MREAETILNIIRKRGKQNLPLGQVYRQLYNPNLYLQSYGRISTNSGAMTKGVDEETVDGMSMQKITDIIDKVRKESYQWKPVKRCNIPKANGKIRSIGMPSWSDKMLQDVIKEILVAYYEPQFSNYSHGFRPKRGCHSALMQIKHNWHGTKWFIEGDIKGCFDNIDHNILLLILKEKVTDNRFLKLIMYLLKAGYMKDWRYTKTMSGTPQGSIVSPILANIYLDKLDQFVENKLLPKYTKGKTRAHNPEYDRLSNQAYQYRKKGLVEQAKILEKQRRLIPSNDPYDPNYRRIRYVRYADDILFGFTGSKEEAEQIKLEIEQFLYQELNLEFSKEKTLITNAATSSAKFLGYAISVNRCDTKITTNRRSINGNIRLSIPNNYVKERSRFYTKGNKPIHRAERTHESDYGIIPIAIIKAVCISSLYT